MLYYVGDLCDVLEISLYDRWIDEECPVGDVESGDSFYQVVETNSPRLATLAIVPQTLWDEDIQTDKGVICKLKNPKIIRREKGYEIVTDEGSYYYDADNRRLIGE